MSPSHIHVPTDCRTVTEILSRVGDKWSVQVVVQLGEGPKRFNELRRLVDGISQRMLTLTLRGLERDGLVTREPDPDDGRATLIHLTARARTFRPVADEVLANLEARVAERLTKKEATALKRALTKGVIEL